MWCLSLHGFWRPELRASPLSSPAQYQLLLGSLKKGWGSNCLTFLRRSERGAIALHSWGGLMLDPGPLASARLVLCFLKASHQWDIWGGRAVQCRHSDHTKVPSRLIRQSPGGATQAHTPQMQPLGSQENWDGSHQARLETQCCSTPDGRREQTCRQQRQAKGTRRALEPLVGRIQQAVRWERKQGKACWCRQGQETADPSVHKCPEHSMSP